MARPFKKLRMLLCGEDVTQEEIAKALGRSKGYVSLRMSGAEVWSLGDVYTLCDMLEIAYEEIPSYFPKEDMRGLEMRTGASAVPFAAAKRRQTL